MEAILIEVERLDRDLLPDIDRIVEALLAAARGAQSPFMTPPHEEIAAAALAEERRLFVASVQRRTTRPDLHADRLPYRRVLTPDESTQWGAESRSRWGVQDGRWHPLLSSEVLRDVLVLADNMA